MKAPTRSTLTALGLLAAFTAQGGAVDDLLQSYKGQGAGQFDATAGATLWQREFPSADGKQRACVSCHTSDLKAAGRHAVTGKEIDPLAPSANPKRLTDQRHIEKWLKRNCKWTIGRECSAQEKGDLLSFIRSK